MGEGKPNANAFDRCAFEAYIDAIFLRALGRSIIVACSQRFGEVLRVQTTNQNKRARRRASKS